MISQSAFLRVLPVLFYEYLGISLTKGLIPSMLLDEFGDWSYVVIGLMEMVKGSLAFLSCPIFGKLSDNIGRRPCLLVSVVSNS